MGLPNSSVWGGPKITTYILTLQCWVALPPQQVFLLIVFLVSAERNRSRKNLLVLLGFFPYLYSLYIMGVLGLYTILEGVIGNFSFLSMIGGIFWVFVGFHLIYRFYLVTEIVRQHDERAVLAHSTLRHSDMS
jgi:hypothetical protein